MRLPVSKALVPLGLFALATVPMVATVANGFAWDDVFLIETNPVVRGGDVVAALQSPYWPDALPGTGLYRPVTAAAATLQWIGFGGSALGFHIVSLLLHGAVTVVLYGCMRRLAGPVPALLGAAVFAVHPVHVEAVANAVGQSELLAALFALLGLMAWQAWVRASQVRHRVLLCAGVAGAYLLALGSKEIAVTLPLLCAMALMAEPLPDGPSRPVVLRRWAMRTAPPAGDAQEPRHSGFPLAFVCGSVLLLYLGLRFETLGTLAGEVPAPELLGLSDGQRVLTGLSVWLDYVRLMLWPVDLSADYGPGVRFPARSIDALVVAGALVFALVGYGAWRLRRSQPVVALGLAWFFVSVLPVSNLLVPAGVLLAERTLYLPSVGLALVVAGLVEGVRAPEVRRRTLALSSVAVLLLAVRSAVRVPIWQDTESVQASLVAGQPASHRVIRARAIEAMEEGRVEEARAHFTQALALLPRSFTLLTEIAQFETLVGNPAQGEALARRAIQVYPHSPNGYAVLARVRRIAGDVEGAREAAHEGLRQAEPLGPIWKELEQVRVGEPSQ